MTSYNWPFSQDRSFNDRFRWRTSGQYSKMFAVDVLRLHHRWTRRRYSLRVKIIWTPNRYFFQIQWNSPSICRWFHALQLHLSLFLLSWWFVPGLHTLSSFLLLDVQWLFPDSQFKQTCAAFCRVYSSTKRKSWYNHTSPPPPFKIRKPAVSSIQACRKCLPSTLFS